MLSVHVLPRSVFAFPASSSCLTTLVPNSGSHGPQATVHGRSAGSHARREFRRRADKEDAKHSALQPLMEEDKADPTSRRGTELARTAHGGERGSLEPLVQERVSGDLLRRYWSDDVSKVLRYEEVNINSSNEGRKDKRTGKDIESETLPLGVALPKAVTDFFLPAGFPDSVSSDYLEYMLWQFPTHVTGWICSTLVTSSLFKAVGVGVGGGYAAAATATIKWVTKDGLGALGLLLIGGKFGTIFDQDPKQWRMYADFVGSAGSIFELATPLAPDQFLLLGSLGYLLKAVAKGLKDPSFRVIQNHFAATDNVGDVSAKEEVWEVSAKLLGLSIAVLLLSMPGLGDSYWKLILVWTPLRSLHLWLRYQSLANVQFSTINYKRAAVLVEAHIKGNPMPGCEECNKDEKLLVWWQLMSPRVRIGCSLKDALELYPSPLEMEELLKIYANEGYVLVLHPNTAGVLEAQVLAKEGVTGIGILRSLWQAYWLLLPCAGDRSLSSSDNFPASGTVEISSVEQSSLKGHLMKLSRSMEAMDLHFDSFLRELEASGWDLDKIVLRVPSNASMIIL